MQKHEEWLWFAEQDLKAAQKLVREDEVILLPAVFHSQQCAEKALKAFLVLKKQPLRKTHDLVQLVKQCLKFDESFELLLDIAVDLNPYVSQSRYPAEMLMIPDLTTVKITIDQAKKVFDFVEQRID